MYLPRSVLCLLPRPLEILNRSCGLLSGFHTISALKTTSKQLRLPWKRSIIFYPSAQIAQKQIYIERKLEKNTPNLRLQ